jgi:hypothetical protein
MNFNTGGLVFDFVINFTLAFKHQLFKEDAASKPE